MIAEKESRMHELAIAQRIIGVIEDEAAKNCITRVTSARLRIGRMAAFQKEQLEFCLASYEKAGTLEGMAFEVEEVPVELVCAACGKRFVDNRFDDEAFAHEVAHAPALYAPPPCPACGAAETEIIAGREMELASIEGI